jgi:hypothetical protein
LVATALGPSVSHHHLVSFSPSQEAREAAARAEAEKERLAKEAQRAQQAASSAVQETHVKIEEFRSKRGELQLTAFHLD